MDNFLTAVHQHHLRNVMRIKLIAKKDIRVVRQTLTDILPYHIVVQEETLVIKCPKLIPKASISESRESLLPSSWV